MKGVVKIALSVALIAVVVLSVVMASVAWFTSSPQVNTNEVTLEAAQTLTVTFDSNVAGTTATYHGQKGNAAEGNDAPCVYEAGGFDLVVRPSGGSSYGKAKVEFGTVSVVHETLTISNVLITDLFHVEANIYKRNNSGDYVKDPEKNHFRLYVAATDGELARYEKVFDDLTVANDGVLKDGAEDALLPGGTFSLAFTYTFLPEAAYAVWEAAVAGEASFSDIHGYELSANGGYIGVVTYTPYLAKYHYGLQRYREEAGVYTQDSAGAYVRVITSYQPYDSVQKYDSEHNAAANGEYIRVGSTDDYVAFFRYRQVNQFPYAEVNYIGASYHFTVHCSIEEVTVDAT